jgi:maltokinase
VLRIHGDLHVGQVLRWRDGYAVIDFDGNPTVDGDAPQPFARDVAQMLTSVAHVGRIAIRRRGGAPAEIAAWTRRNCDDLLAAYVAGLGDRVGLFDAALVGPFAVEQECRELIYAARYRPTWRYAAMGVLRAWFDEGATA